MRVLLNFTYLLLSKGSGLLLFLVATPLIVGRVGLENLGLVSIALSLVYIFDAFVEYSFNITVVQDIAINKHDKQKISSVFTATFFAKSILLITAFIVYFGIVIAVPQFRQYLLLYISSFLFVIGRAFNPIWFFMGIEKMQFITITSVISKVLYLLLIHLFVTNESNFVYVNLFLGLSEVLSSLVILVYLANSNKITLLSFSLTNSLALIVRDYKFACSLLLLKIYNNVPLVFIGVFSSPFHAGIYSIAEKIVMNIKDVVGLLYNAAMPYFSRLFISNKTKAIKSMWMLTLILSLLYMLAVIPIYYFSNDIVLFFSKNNIEDIKLILMILFMSVFFLILRLPHSIYITLKRLDDKLLFSTIYSTVLVIFLCYWGVIFMDERGVAISVLTGEIFFLILLSFFLLRNEKLFFKIKTTE
jgi:PST family polysaccharide transporter